MFGREIVVAFLAIMLLTTIASAEKMDLTVEQWRGVQGALLTLNDREVIVKEADRERVTLQPYKFRPSVVLAIAFDADALERALKPFELARVKLVAQHASQAKNGRLDAGSPE